MYNVRDPLELLTRFRRAYHAENESVTKWLHLMTQLWLWIRLKEEKEEEEEGRKEGSSSDERIPFIPSPSFKTMSQFGINSCEGNGGELRKIPLSLPTNLCSTTAPLHKSFTRHQYEPLLVSICQRCHYIHSQSL